MLADGYGWTADYILDNVSLDEAIIYIEKINLRKIRNYKMMLAIAQNPHIKESKKLWRVLDAAEREASPREYIDDQLDRGGLARLKMQMGKKGSRVKTDIK